MEEYRILRALDRARPLFERMGVDYPAMRRILGLKLTLDGRRTSGAAALFGGSMKSGGGPLKPKEQPAENAGSGRILFFYALYGGLSSLFLLTGGTYMLQAGIVLTVLLFIMMTAMLSDFSSVLLDVRDKPILHTKPVDGRTLGMAKALHVLIYFMQCVLALGVVPVLVGALRYGPGFALLLLASLILGGLLVAVFTAFVYLLVLKLFDGETLKDMINYVQIAMTVFMLVGYQIAIRAMDLSRLSAEFRPGWWELALPPLWYAAGFEWLLSGRSDPLYIAPSLLGLILPPLGAIVFYRSMPMFERNLEKLSGGAARARRPRAGARSRRLANLLCRSAQERAFYVFASSMLSGEREFKLKVYPSLGFSLAVPFIFLFSFAVGSGGLSGIDFEHGAGYLNVYSCAIMIPTVVGMMQYSGNFKGSWIYGAAPLGSPDALYRGTLKALFVRLFLPLFLVEAVVFSMLFGIRILPDLLAVLAASALMLPVSLRMTRSELPFSLPFPTSNSSGGFQTILAMLVLALLAAVHYAIWYFLPAYGVWLLLALMIGANARAWSRSPIGNR
ncbi:hypothetical protein QWJ34_10000 [Saccharibacillus sp. CPCC 101409]|uniref:hypothetical protein n=1 Tax=Saccharibacillus sp. CPCC 101409 TaxID=3058041 RepID=UPI0026733D94|nr:hypothetical protein [Saccharibacillus sp. CPCC 101409]MDO3410093.1 hypothetical protein [Saccharibacillus sp. CPCC 101409]